MKERIIVTNKRDIDFIETYKNVDYTKEQVPETFEELKELCKDIKGDLKLTSDGKIYCYEYLIAENRTPAQMWNIIKNLTGEA